jgi:two-component system nitrogen regulation response regulator GlnG
MSKLLVVDDEPNVRYSLEKSLSSPTLKVIVAGTGSEGIEQVRTQRPDAVILDVRLPDMTGLQAFDQIRRIDPHLPIIVVTAYATTEAAIEAMKRGAYEYLLKPVDLHQLRECVMGAIDLSRLQKVPAPLEGEETNGHDEEVDPIVGKSAIMQEVYKAIGRVAPLDVPVLILGESGTGKELVARAIYQHSRRNQGQFQALNCAALPESLLESELFGHEKGAFTGADRKRIGRFEQADRGTLFLDEVGDMPRSVQPKVLRLLQEQQFERLGGNETVQSDVRIIAATNQDLAGLVADGRFRQDLYYRLKVFTIQLPALRERREDIPQLIEHFIKKLSPQLGKSVRTIAPETLQVLQAQDWLGNVRELQSAIKYALVRARGEVLTLDCLPASVIQPSFPAGPTPETAASALDLGAIVTGMLRAGEPDVYRRVGLIVDRLVLEATLRHTKGNQVQASELLGISRTTLRAKLRALGLTVEKQIYSDEGE